MRRTPTGPLRRFVDSYIGYRLTGFPPGVHRGLPSRHQTFIVSIGPDINVVRQTDSAQRPDRYRCVVSGLQPSSALIAHDGTQKGVAIELTPLGSRALLGLPAGEVWNLSLEFADVAGPAGDELWERLQIAADWNDRFAICDEVLSRVATDDHLACELEHSWRALVASGGSMSIGELATATGWSRQHLARRFRDEFGLGPKLAGRIIRLDRARRMLQGSPPFVTITQVAAACGYFDHAHLNRDFAELAGCTPSELLAERLPSFQATATGGVARSGHEFQRRNGLADPVLP
jgi:AraC-like DNA-binding protein